MNICKGYLLIFILFSSVLLAVCSDYEPHSHSHFSLSNTDKNICTIKHESGSSINEKVDWIKSYRGKVTGSELVMSFIDFIYNSGLVFSQDVCFTNGAFVFEDNDGRMFKAISDSSHSHHGLIKNIITKYQDGVINNVSWKTSHRSFKNNINVESTYNINKGIWQPILVRGKVIFNQYEYEIPRGYVIKCPLVNNSPLLKHIQSQIKKCMLFYHFRCKNRNKSYTYIKLEMAKVMSKKHFQNAFEFYVLRNKKNKYLDTYRETEKCTSKSILKNRRLIDSLQDDELRDANSSFEYYDDKVRVGNEYFIPQCITERIIKKIFRK